MTIYQLSYRESEHDKQSSTIGLYSSFKNAQRAGERAYKNLTGEKEFRWTIDYGNYVRFDRDNGITSCLDISPLEIDSVLI